MKGMQAIKRGSGFNGLLKYALSHEKAAVDGRVIGGTMNGLDVKSLTKEFKETRILRPDIKKPVWHNSLRLPKDDPCTDIKWGEITQDYMAKMGFDVKKTQYVIVKHDDENGIHIIASRIQKDGSLYLGKNENLASTRHISDLEKSHGLTVTKGLEYDETNHIITPKTDLPKRTAAEVHKAIRTGVPVPKDQIRSIISTVLAKGNCSATQFKKQLESVGVQVWENVSKGEPRRLNGFSFAIVEHSNVGPKEARFKGSELAYSWKTLQAAGVTYDSATDFRINAPAPAVTPALEPELPDVIELKKRAWDEQAIALDADAYIVHCDRDSDDLEPIEPSKTPIQAYEVRDAIASLTEAENLGYSISVEPVSKQWNYLMCPGLEKGDLERMKMIDYSPTFALQTTPTMTDVVLRVPKLNESDYEDNAVREISMKLTQKYGDALATTTPKKIGIAGFKQGGFIATIIDAKNVICAKAKSAFDNAVLYAKALVSIQSNNRPRSGSNQPQNNHVDRSVSKPKSRSNDDDFSL